MSESPSADPTALFNEGLAHHQRGDAARAEEIYRQVLALHPMHFDALHLLGVIAMQNRNFDRAVELIGMAIAVEPNNPLYADAYSNRGMAFRALGKNTEAVASYTQAIKLRPDHAAAYFNRANAYRDLNRGADALADIERAAKLSPENADAAYNRGLSLAAMEHPSEAMNAFRDARRLQPNLPYVDGLFLFEKLNLCDWLGFAGEVTAISERTVRGERASPPYPTLAFLDDPALLRKTAEIWTNDKFPANPAREGTLSHPAHDRIRIGYFSEAFRRHPTSHQILPVLETHDRRKFEIFAFSYGSRVDVDDEMRPRIVDAVEHFVDIAGNTDAEVVALSRRSEIDIAVDLTGHTGTARTGIFAQRAAPVQVNAIGYPGTMGAGYMDYILGDATVIPEAARSHYREKVIYMPGCYHTAPLERVASQRSFTRKAIGLPPDGIVFCSLGASNTIHPAMFASWMRILKAVPGSTLMLRYVNISTATNLRDAAASHGVAPDTLVFASPGEGTTYAAQFRAADLYLDTAPHNAGLTSTDALAAGLPVLTRTTPAFVGRMTASQLLALSLPALIVETADAYEERAIALAQSPERLKALKAMLSLNSKSGSLFDARRYTAALEDAYGRIYGRHKAGLAPEHIFL